MRDGQWLVLLVLLAPAVQAETWFSIHVQDLVDNIECFDPATCSPMDGVALVSPIGSEELWEFPILAYGPGGMPPSYHFVIPDGGDYPYSSGSIHRIEVPWFGPGFRYTYSESYGPFDFFYLTGIGEIPLFPNPVVPGSGCICDPPTGWVWAECEDGPIPLDQEFIVPAGFVLEIEAGTHIRAFPGALIRVEGALVCRGNEEAGVVFEGDDWHGIEFAPGATAELSYTRITGVVDDWDGGALSLEPGSEVALDHCILHHNSTSESGGGAFVDDGALLRLRSCTLSHNSAGSGGNLYVEDGGFATGLYNLVTFGTPQTMVSEDGPLASNLNYSMLYPLADPSQGTGWYCDPGYADAANGDFALSYWNPADPDTRNCVIDVASIDGDLDPDGTPMDMGAMPLDQSAVLHPARILEVADRPGDQGAMVTLTFAASPNDGAGINPVSMYSIWMRYPGSVEMVPSGMALGALGLPVYSLQIPTQWDSTASNGNTPDEYAYTFYVCTHSATHPLLRTFSDSLTGYSIDNLAPEAVTGFGPDGEWVEEPIGETFHLDLEWDSSPANDFDHFELFYLDPDGQQSTFLGHIHDTRFRHTVPYLVGDVFIYTIVARDHAGNESPVSTCTSPIDPFIAVEREPSMGFALEQNHPNPFNPNTTLRYDLARMVDVSLRVFNMQGRMVRELVQGRQAAGRYERVFDANELASGVYFLQLRAGDFVQTRKLVLLR